MMSYIEKCKQRSMLYKQQAGKRRGVKKKCMVMAMRILWVKDVSI